MYRLRFAPSPTGSPHIGNIRTAVFDYLFARHTGGTFILRVEDTDQARYQAGSLEEMMAGLRWIGMQWDEGPEVGGDYGPYFQSERLNHYNKYVQLLLNEGKAYYCYCSKERLEELRASQMAAKLPPGYDRRCRDLSDEERGKLSGEVENPVIRFKMKREGVTEFDDVVRGKVSFRNELEDDFVIIKADGFPTYHFASIVDDYLMKITHVIRGEEWVSSAPKHLQLYEAFGWNPPIWVHPPLILDEKGKKLAKRSDTSTRFMDYIKEGYLPDAMLNFLATMGWSSGEDRKLYSRTELIEKFSLEGIVSHPAIFDQAKLNDLNGEYIRMMSVDELMDAIMPYIKEAKYISDNASKDDMDYLREIAPLIQDRIVTLKDAPNAVAYFYNDELEYEEKGALKWFTKEATPSILNEVADNLAALETWDIAGIETAVRSVSEKRGIKPLEVIHPTRMAITGRTWGPGLFDVIRVLGKDKCVGRLRKIKEIMLDYLYSK